MAEDALRLKIEGPIANLIIDRSASRNAFNLAMWDTVPELVARAMEDDAVRVLLLRSGTPGIFSAGADLREMAGNSGSPDWLKHNQAVLNRALDGLARAAKPTIAFIEGDCMGAGCAIAVACDLRVASARARFGVTPAKMGLVYPFEDTRRLVDLIGPATTKRLLFTGRVIDAAEALRMGLVDEIADDADALVATILAASGCSHRTNKAFVGRALDGQSADDDATSASFLEAFSGRDFKEGVDAFLTKRKPVFD